METDTIVAVATAPGEAGVGIVRVSGPLARELPARLLPDLAPPWESHRLRHGRILDPQLGQELDEVLACVMKAPYSYTGEDVLEIHGHGNPLSLERIVSACLSQGCRAARPGEFTLRAFLSGRLDLTQAEAVLDLVRARTNAGLEMALEQLRGHLGSHIEPVRQTLVGIAAQMEAMVDFVEEDVPPRLDDVSRQKLEQSRAELQAWLTGTEQGIVFREGASLAIVGSPNVGKSSIMNGLLGSERSIVTPIPGTTRDTVEEVLEVRGVPFRVVDTAGITETEDVVEQIGVDRSLRSLQTADVVLLVIDRSRPLNSEDELTFTSLLTARSNGDSGRKSRLVVALNKSDLPERLKPFSLAERLEPLKVVESCTVTPSGLDQLRGALAEAALGGDRHEHVSGNARHRDSLRLALGSLDSAISGLSSGTPVDLVSLDVRAAVQSLGEITGTNVDEELLDRIFRDFCIGK